MYYDTQIYRDLNGEDVYKVDKVYKFLAYFFAVLSIMHFLTPSFTGRVFFSLVGCLLVMAALSVLFTNFYIIKNSWGSFTISFLLALIYGIMGFFFIKNPMGGVKFFAFIVAISFFMLGLFRFISKYKQLKTNLKENWVSVLLITTDVSVGSILIFTWPNNSLFVISVVLGIQFFVLTIRFFQLHFLLETMKAH